MLPFVYEGYATKETFFGRKDELNKLNNFASNSNNLLIYSLRRFGKSSLVKEQMRRDKNTLYIYFDIFEITSQDDFVRLFLEAIVDAQKGSMAAVLKNLGKMFSRISFEAGFDATTGKAKFSPTVKNIDFTDAMREILDALAVLKKKQKVVVIIDEFQQITLVNDVKIDAVMRKYMQENEDIAYFFLGSKRHTLNDLFQYKAPLYEMATHYELQGILLEDYISYIQKHLKISDELVAYLVDTARDETKLVMHVCSILYDRDVKKTITKEMIDTVVKEVAMSKDGSYSMIYDNFSLTKKKAFKVLVSHRDPFKKETLEKYSISKQALSSAFNALFKDEFIDKSDGWLIPDRTLELWGEFKFSDS